MLGQFFFKDYYLMDAELLGGGGRKYIAEEAIKAGMKPLLPPGGAVLLQRVAVEDRSQEGQGPREPRGGQDSARKMSAGHLTGSSATVAPIRAARYLGLRDI